MVSEYVPFSFKRSEQNSKKFNCFKFQTFCPICTKIQLVEFEYRVSIWTFYDLAQSAKEYRRTLLEIDPFRANLPQKLPIPCEKR